MKLNRKQIAQVLNKTNCKCAYCGKEILGDVTFVYHEIEEDTIFATCRSCSSMKRGNPTLEHFRYSLTCKVNKIPRFTNEQIDYLKNANLLQVIFPKPVRFYFETL